ncbi:MAG: ROK family protein, partial [Desulfurococcaceae archaeon]
MYIVVDIGASKIRIGLATFEKVVEKIVLQTPRVGDEYTIANLIIDKIVEKYGIYIDRVRAI